MNLEQRARRAEGLSMETKHRLTMLNTFLSDGEYPILPLEPERTENASGWPLWVGICSAAAVAIMAAYFWVAW